MDPLEQHHCSPLRRIFVVRETLWSHLWWIRQDCLCKLLLEQLGDTPRGEEVAAVWKTLETICNLKQGGYQSVLAFLRPVRLEEMSGQHIDYATRTATFMRGANYEDDVSRSIFGIQASSLSGVSESYQAAGDELSTEWVLWARLMREKGMNVLNPENNPKKPSAFPLDRRLRFWLEGWHGLQKTRGDPLTVKHYPGKSVLQFHGARWRHGPRDDTYDVPNDGSIVTVGRPLKVSRFFGQDLPVRLEVNPDFLLTQPYSRMGLQVCRTENGFEVYDNLSWMPLEWDDGQKRGDYRSDVTQGGDGHSSIGIATQFGRSDEDELEHMTYTGTGEDDGDHKHEISHPHYSGDWRGGKTEVMRGNGERVEIRQTHLPDNIEEEKPKGRGEPKEKNWRDKIKGLFRWW